MGIVEMLLLGVGLSMDACAVSMANGFNPHCKKLNKVFLIAFLFGLFQGLMPLLGYFVAHSILFDIISKFAPYVSLIVLTIIGGKMIADGMKNDEDADCCSGLGFKLLLIQAIATSIDALSVGLVLASFKVKTALLASLVIALVTFALSLVAVFIGKKFGTILQNKAQLLGGIILVLIGVFIFIKGIL